MRWTYILPRAILVGLVWAFFHFAFDPLLRRGLIAAGQKAAHATVDVAGLSTTFVTPAVTIDRVSVANRRQPGTNLIEFANLHANLETRALLKKSCIVQEASLSGLRWGTRRTDSGLLPGDTPEAAAQEDFESAMLNGLKQQLTARGKNWLAGLLSRAKLDFDPRQFESVRLGQELEDRWPKDFDRYDAELDALKQRIDQLRKSVKIKDGSELEKIDRYTQAARSAERLLREIEQLRAGFDQSLRQARDDWHELETAKARDLAKLREKADILHLDPDEITELLLGPEMSQRLEQAIGWVKFIRERIALATDEPEPTRLRGQTIQFPRQKELPLFLVRLLSLDGEGEFGGESLAFKGTVTGLTTNPKIHGEPTIVRMQADGGAAVLLKAVLDHTLDVPEHHVLLSYKEPRPDRKELGQSDSVRLAVATRGSEWLADLKFVGDELSGHIACRQALAAITAQVGEKRFQGDERLATVLQSIVGGIDHIDANLQLSGSMRKPRVKLQSNLGRELAAGVNTAFARQLEAGRRELLVRFDQEAAKRTAKLTQLYDEQFQKVTGKMQLNQGEVHEIAQTFGLKMPGGFDLKRIASGLPNKIKRPLDPNKPLDINSLGQNLPKLPKALPKFDEQPESEPLPTLPKSDGNRTTKKAADAIRQASEVEQALEGLGLFGKKPKPGNSRTVKPANEEQPQSSPPSSGR